MATAVETKVVVNTSHETGKVQDAKVHRRDPLLDQIGFNFGARRHAHRLMELGERQRDLVLIRRHLGELEPTLSIRDRRFSILQTYFDAPEARLPNVVGAVNVHVTENTPHDHASAIGQKQ